MATTEDFLFEIGLEELPAVNQHGIAKLLEKNLCSLLNKNSIHFGKSESFVTPKRLAVLIHDIAIEQPNIKQLRKGPALNAAFDTNGKPKPAAIGFAKSCGVAIEDLQHLETPQGTWLAYEQQLSGKKTIDLLPAFILDAVNKLSFNKRMRWGDSEYSFVRPVHWLLVLFGKEIVPYQQFGLTSNKQTFGHRFHHPQAITIDTPKKYENVLEEQGKVIASFSKRQTIIEQQIHVLAKKHGGHIKQNMDLLEEVTGLVEWPVSLAIDFDENFLEVPNEALESAMTQHQKCFPIVDSKQKLLPWFIAVSNIESKNPAKVIEGNKRVMHARLADAAFFYHTDKKLSLESRFTALEKLIFQQKLGSIADKSNRTSRLAGIIARELNIDTKASKQAGLLTKCDLATDMVFEFPELQGTMGYYYALNDGIDESIAIAIKEHYQPRFANDNLPSSPLACSVALADKLDTLCAIFAIGLKPTGDKDPFALRRATLGIIRIIIENKCELDLSILIEAALKPIQDIVKNKQNPDDILHFVYERLRYWYLEKNITPDVIAAVLAKRPTNLLDFDARIKAIQYFITLPEAETLTNANKRVINILNKNLKVEAEHSINQDLLDMPAEKELVNQIKQTQHHINQADDYKTILQNLVQLDSAIDQFFTDVMVMHENEAIKTNRLAILLSLQKLLSLVADISLLQNTCHETSHTG